MGTVQKERIDVYKRQVLNSLPKSALAPLLIVWLGARQRTIIVAGMSVAIFGSILNLYTGFGEISQEKLCLLYTSRCV